MCFNADTGKLLWEHRYNLFNSDVPPHRIAWSSPAVDPATGNVFAISGGGLLMSMSKDGKLLWERSLAEEFGMWTTHGGRMSSPVIDRDQVIVSGLTYLWGQHSGGAHRFLSFDKTSGQTNWVSSPEGRPTDTIYANPFIADVNGVRTFFSGGSDGAMYALKVNTGEPIWNWKVSQRGLNTAALVIGDDLIITHSEENIGTSEMGMVGGRSDRVERSAGRQGCAVAAARCAGRVRVSRQRRRAPLPARQRRRADRDRSQDRQTVVERGPRHDRQGLTGLCGRQAVHRNREHRERRRQSVHHQTDCRQRRRFSTRTGSERPRNRN